MRYKPMPLGWVQLMIRQPSGGEYPTVVYLTVYSSSDVLQFSGTLVTFAAVSVTKWRMYTGTLWHFWWKTIATAHQM